MNSFHTSYACVVEARDNNHQGRIQPKAGEELKKFFATHSVEFCQKIRKLSEIYAQISKNTPIFRADLKQNRHFSRFEAQDNNFTFCN